MKYNYRNGRPYIECSIEGCQQLTSAIHGMCTPHYKQQWYLKSVGRTEKIQRTSKERWTHKDSGYVMIKPRGYLEYEHRYIAEKALGKPLPAESIVHHTGAPDDNRGPFKLIICPNQEYHMLLHKRARDLGYEDY